MRRYERKKCAIIVDIFFGEIGNDIGFYLNVNFNLTVSNTVCALSSKYFVEFYCHFIFLNGVKFSLAYAFVLKTTIRYVYFKRFFSSLEVSRRTKQNCG